ncbi:MAG TPA: carbonic anhydrase [Phnomibacter sp.]|nr:carbonic anhydrase [Phnomibacter sp.]
MSNKTIFAILGLAIFPIFAIIYTKKKSSAEEEKPAIEAMMDGNARFASAHSRHPDEGTNRSREVALVQHPKAVVIACSDSRVSPELVFDEGLGDLFVIRSAGNILGQTELGSVEYAVEHLEVPLIIVMGHERCGAVKAMVDGAHESGSLQSILDSLNNEAEIQAIPLDDSNRLEQCVLANIRHGVKALSTQSKVVHEKLEEGKLKIVGVRYDLDDRKVTIVQ